MKRIIYSIFSLISLSCFSQSWATKEEILIGNYKSITDKSVFITKNNDTITEVMYPNGHEGIIASIQEYFVYPKKAIKRGLEGKVLVSYVVEKNGYLSSIKVIEGVHPVLDKEAVRIVKKLDRFIPGMDQNGNPVRMAYTVPINFIKQ